MKARTDEIGLHLEAENVQENLILQLIANKWMGADNMDTYPFMTIQFDTASMNEAKNITKGIIESYNLQQKIDDKDEPQTELINEG